MKRALIGLFLSFSLSLAVGCGAKQDSDPSTSGKASAADDEEEVSETGKKWGGWRWKGKRNDCFFVYKNECFAKLKQACKKAGCSGDACGHDSSAPAKVSCDK